MSQSLHNAAAGINFWLLSSGCAHSPAQSFHKRVGFVISPCRLNQISLVLNSNETTSNESSVGGTRIHRAWSRHTTRHQPNQRWMLRCWVAPAQSEKHTGSKSPLSHHFLILILVHFNTASKPGTTTTAISNHEWALTHPFTNYCWITYWTVQFSWSLGFYSWIRGTGALCVTRKSLMNYLNHSLPQLLTCANRKKK